MSFLDNIRYILYLLVFLHSLLFIMPTALTVSSRTPSPARQTVPWQIREPQVVSGRLRGRHSRTRGRESDWHHRPHLQTCRCTNGTNQTCTPSYWWREFRSKGIKCLLSFQAFDYEQKKLLATKGKDLIKHFVFSST